MTNPHNCQHQTSSFYPQADLEQSNLINDWMYWGFIADDQVFENGDPNEVKPMAQKIIDIMEGRNCESSTNPFISVLIKIYESVFKSFPVLAAKSELFKVIETILTLVGKPRLIKRKIKIFLLKTMLFFEEEMLVLLWHSLLAK